MGLPQIRNKYSTVTAGDGIYLSLRENILSLALKPGQELVIKDLAEMLHVSRSPVRDALMRLNSDGLVEIFPQRGSRVARIDLERVDDERFLRRSLEEYAVRHYIQDYRPGDLSKMESMIQKQRKAQAAKRPAAFLRYDDDFHSVLFSAIGRDNCWGMVKSQSNHYHRIRVLSSASTEMSGEVIRQHEQLVDALGRGDLDAALAVERHHLSKLEAEKAALLAQYPDYFA